MDPKLSKNICSDKPYCNLNSNCNLNHTVNLTALMLASGSVENQAKEFFQKLSGDEAAKEIINKIIAAKTALDENKTDRAEKILQKAISIGEEANGLPTGLACAYEMLASIACQKGDIAKAEHVVISALRKFKSVKYSCSNNIVISFSMKLARLYQENNKFEAAETIFRKCLDVQEKKYYRGQTDIETSKLWVNTLFWYGKLLHEKQRYKEAVKCFETCYHLSCQVKSVQIPQVMVILHNLAEAAYFNGDKDKALRHLLHAVMLGRLTTFSELPVFYIRIGNLYTEKGEYIEAKLWYEGARKISKAMKNKDQEAEAEATLKNIDSLMENI
ncbi:tetratricopeptide repeat protein 19, mitochondrial-like [Lycorma delicatula]|uniref:tetratricopeptide repeat protein 19, mitochondrial-like n=1 Tax=Lycorma delicatula TaxID=130591 RepID=UPI003F517C97